MADQPKTVDDVKAIVEERQIRFIRLWFTDILGQLKSFSVNKEELDDAFDGRAQAKTPREIGGLTLPQLVVAAHSRWRAGGSNRLTQRWLEIPTSRRLRQPSMPASWRRARCTTARRG